MTVNPLDQSPENHLIDSLFTIAAPKGNSWAELDISKFAIDLPQEGFFVAVEDLAQALDSIWYYEHYHYDTNEVAIPMIDTCYGLIFKNYYRKYKDMQDTYWQQNQDSLVLSKVIDSLWWNAYKQFYIHSQTWKGTKYYNKPHTPNSRNALPRIQVEIAYHSKTKKKSPELPTALNDEIACHKLTKKTAKCLFDIPKFAPVQYSQSTIKELLKSVRTGIDDQNWPYVLYYLFAYPDSFMNELPEHCKAASKEKASIKNLFAFSQQEHHQIIATLDSLLDTFKNNELEQLSDNIYSLRSNNGQTLFFYFDGQYWRMLMMG